MRPDAFRTLSLSAAFAIGFAVSRAMLPAPLHAQAEDDRNAPFATGGRGDVTFPLPEPGNVYAVLVRDDREAPNDIVFHRKPFSLDLRAETAVVLEIHAVMDCRLGTCKPCEPGTCTVPPVPLGYPPPQAPPPGFGYKAHFVLGPEG